MAIPEILGERIAAALDSVGLTQIEAAKRLGVTRQTIGRWTGGAEVTEAALEQLAILVERSPAWLRYGLVDAVAGGIAEYQRGYSDAKEHMRQHLNRMEPSLNAVLDESQGRIGRHIAELPFATDERAPLTLSTKARAPK
jgi:transcriptional regulator with XRE-family HTH domain